MKMNITSKQMKIISLTLACWGTVFIGSGLLLNGNDKTIVETSYSLQINKNKVASTKTNEIKLKDMKSEINLPLSVDIKDYLDDINNLDGNTLKQLKLDTSMVNIQEAGTYTYTISYKKKKYNGQYTINEKELPAVNLTLKNLTLDKDSILDTNPAIYIQEAIDNEVLNNIVLDLSKVKPNIEGTYQYSIIYNNKLYTANITIIAPKTIIKTPSQETEDKNNNQTTNDNTTSSEQIEEKPVEENQETEQPTE